MPGLWFDLLIPQDKGPPVQTFSFLQVLPSGEGPDPMPFIPVLLDYLEILLAALVE